MRRLALRDLLAGEPIEELVAYGTTRIVASDADPLMWGHYIITMALSDARGARAVLPCAGIGSKGCIHAYDKVEGPEMLGNMIMMVI